jgi:hypothetical protein
VCVDRDQALAYTSTHPQRLRGASSPLVPIKIGTCESRAVKMVALILRRSAPSCHRHDKDKDTVSAADGP